MKKLVLGLLVSASLVPSIASAHTPLFDCYLDDSSVLCEGGFSDGSSASGVEILVVDTAGKNLITSKLNEDAEIEFDKPEVEYKVIFNAGPGHTIEKDGKDIVE